MTNTFPIYKFVSLRSPISIENSNSPDEITLQTTLVATLTSINDSDDTNALKLTNYNVALQSFIDSSKYIKTQQEFDAFKESALATQDEPDLFDLYDNILVKTLTKSNTNTIFKQCVDFFKELYTIINSNDAVEVIIPNKITPKFLFLANAPEDTDMDENNAIGDFELIKKFTRLEQIFSEALADGVITFNSGSYIQTNRNYSNILNYLKVDDVTVSAALDKLKTQRTKASEFSSGHREFNLGSEAKASQNSYNLELHYIESLESEIQSLNLVNEAIIGKTIVKNSAKYDEILGELSVETIDVAKGLAEIKETLVNLAKKIPSLFKSKKFGLIGNNWVDVSAYNENTADSEPDTVLQNGEGCDLKIPYRVADLRVIEKQSVGYLPGEIAHINNTQSGEANTRVTRRLKKTETLESLFLEDHTFSETDTQSTEKFSIEKEASSIQSSANATSINSSASGTYGPISATLNAGYSNYNSSSNSNSVSQTQAKEVMKSIVESVSHKVQSTRSVTTTEEFEEIVTHEIDNKLGGTKSYVYRWLNKLVRGTLKNYGKRLIFELDVAHPSAFYVSRSIQDFPTISIPPDPRTAQVNGNPIFTRNSITRNNYLYYADLYEATVEEPPKEYILVSDVLNSKESVLMGKLLSIPQDYECKTAKIISYMNAGWPDGNFLVYTIGRSSRAFWNDAPSDLWGSPTYYLNDETEQLPISVESKQNGFYLNIEVSCKLSAAAYDKWKNKVYDGIISAYETLKEGMEDELAAYNPNLPGINPSKKTQLIHDELKKGAIQKMFKCNPFWVNDRYIVGEEYVSNCCLDTLNAEKVKFLESVFDWRNMTYQLHPYFYARKNNWTDLLGLTDDDPHFESFLQASYGTVQIPVHRDALMERAAINFVLNNSIANYEVIPEGASTILDDLKDLQPTKFTTDLDGTELPEPTDTVDLGIFEVPTNLVILECGNADGIKPIGFPVSTVPPTIDVIIPKQFSPAIIADTCENPG